MQKCTILFVLLIWSLTGTAAPVGNTAAPKLIRKGWFSHLSSSSSLRSGYEGDFVADGRMNQYEEGAGRVDEYFQETNAGTVTLNFSSKVDLYALFGTSSAKSNWRFSDQAGLIHRIQTRSETQFLWGIGARAIYYEWRSLSLGIGGRYTESQSRPAWATSDGSPLATAGALFDWKEWQINLDFSYTIRLFTPYIGVKYADARTYLAHFSAPISQSGTGNNHFKNRGPVGLYLGAGFSTGDYLMCNVEGRLIDEEALTLSADIKF